MSDKTCVTLIGCKLADIGMEFIFQGKSSECEGCKLTNSCLNLEVGRRYKVLGLRGGIKQRCLIHESGVVAVEVTESPTTASIESRRAFNGSKIFYDYIDCDDYGCEFYNLCHPPGLKNGDKCTILKVTGDIPGECCSKGLSLKLAELKR